MPDPDLYTRTFTREELVTLAKAVRFNRRMLERTTIPQEQLDELSLVYLRVVGVDLPIEGIAA